MGHVVKQGHTDVNSMMEAETRPVILSDAILSLPCDAISRSQLNIKLYLICSDTILPVKMGDN